MSSAVAEAPVAENSAFDQPCEQRLQSGAHGQADVEVVEQAGVERGVEHSQGLFVQGMLVRAAAHPPGDRPGRGGIRGQHRRGAAREHPVFPAQRGDPLQIAVQRHGGVDAESFAEQVEVRLAGCRRDLQYARLLRIASQIAVGEPAPVARVVLARALIVIAGVAVVEAIQHRDIQDLIAPVGGLQWRRGRLGGGRDQRRQGEQQGADPEQRNAPRGSAVAGGDGSPPPPFHPDCAPMTLI